MTKNELRDTFRLQRQALSPVQCSRLSAHMHNIFFDYVPVSGKRVHLFLPILKFNEPDTFKILRGLFIRPDVTVYTSVTHSHAVNLTHVKIEPGTVYKNDKWGIPMPVGAKAVINPVFDIILVPLLCCDVHGNRVGYGKGHYDAFLAGQPQACKIGLSYFNPVEPIDDVYAGDVPLDAMIIPTQFIRFSHGKKA